ncbi:MAG: VCBS repeat-containing protein, partial [Candidatus Krumholzibacteriota bacterium]|nr:VCBS repeat-containing protein [Candidatus Krumholzibacteriota bacterium]
MNFEIAVREDSVDMWYDDLNEQSHAPELSLVTLRINDTASGNGDGIVDAGEEFRLYYRLKNFGTGEAPPASATIRDLDGAFVFTDSIDAYAALGSLQEAENAGGFLLRESDVSTGHRLEIKVTDAFSRAYIDTFELRAPAAPSGVVINPALGIDRLELSWTASASADVHAYVVYRSQVPGGPYTIATADPVIHTLFLDVGLSASTTYYYVVTAVDSSGNESGSSAEKGGSTNPAQVEGWPIAMADETVSSPVLGDIDGDGDIEIVQGGNYMYAWHHNGDELIDGDADPQTWGVLSTAGLDFVSHTALGRIDGQPGLDIVAASRTTKEVYVFDYTGTPVTGWPRPVENTIRAGVAVGDLDGDGRLEIVACDERGVLYAWNADGSELIDGDMNPGTPGVLYRLPGCSFQYSGPAVVDIDGDGKDEVIIGTQGDSLYVINDDASVSPGWPYPLGSDVSGSVAVGDLDNDGDLEIVANTFSGFVRALHHDGSLLWTRWFSNNVFFAPSPALGDVTGDGFLETFVPSSDRSLYAVTHTGATLTGWPVPFSTTTTTESSPIIVDINGDGSPDIVLGDEAGMIHGWDAGGNLLDGFPLAMTDAARAVPAAGDVDGDGDIEIVAAGWDKFVYVWDFDGVYDPSKAPWPGYHANVHNSGYAESFVPTGITGVSFSFRITAGVPELSWWMPDETGSRFHIARATSHDGEAGKFAVIAYNVTRESDGTVIYLDRGAQPGDRYVYRIESADDKALF